MAKEKDQPFENADVSPVNRGTIESESLDITNSIASIVKQADDLSLVDEAGYIAVINRLGNRDALTVLKDEVAGDIQTLIMNGWQLRLSTDDPAYDKKAIMTLPGTTEVFISYGEVYKAATYWQKPSIVVEVKDIYAIADYAKGLHLDSVSTGSEASPALSA
jgi:hypothetical protein